MKKVELQTRFVPVRHLARGGMASVELAVRYGDRFARPCVLKRPFELDEGSRRRLLDEARIAGLVDDPRVVSVLDVGEDDRGVFLVMDYVEGASLAEVLVKARARDELLPVDVVLYIVAQIALALNTAHHLVDSEGRDLSLVHRDVSPSNILLAFSGHVKLTDFGIACYADGRRDVTQDGIVRGKASYMSPEQLALGAVDLRSDLYSLGIVLFESLTLVKLFPEGRSTDINLDLHDHRNDVTDGINELLLELLAEDPDRRPPGAREVAERLTKLGAATAHDAEHAISEWLRLEFEDRRRQLREDTVTALENASDGQRRRRPRWFLVVMVSILLSAALVAFFAQERMEPSVVRATQEPLTSSKRPEPSSAAPPGPANPEPGRESTAPEPIEREFSDSQSSSGGREASRSVRPRTRRPSRSSERSSRPKSPTPWRR
ncbi:MAG: serine/threonine-protein kinase [Myxococcota bacterium]